MEIILKYFSDFTPEQLKQFAKLDPLYKEWNSKINVISRKDIDGLYEKHVLHSLAIAATFRFEPAMEILDIGTGGGFPGIPLAIFFPEVKFLLADSIAKKIKSGGRSCRSIGVKERDNSACKSRRNQKQEIRFRGFPCCCPFKRALEMEQAAIKKKSGVGSPDPGRENEL